MDIEFEKTMSSLEMAWFPFLFPHGHIQLMMVIQLLMNT